MSASGLGRRGRICVPVPDDLASIKIKWLTPCPLAIDVAAVPGIEFPLQPGVFDHRPARNSLRASVKTFPDPCPRGRSPPSGRSGTLLW
jgi:hypothetical protein